MFYYSQQHDLAVAQIPKAGLRTISGWLQPGFRVVKNDAALAASRRVAFIRHPIERLKSCYSFFYWQKQRGQPVADVPLGSWQEFVDHVLDPATVANEHWMPQANHVGSVPNIYRRFENIAQTFEEYWPGILPHNGAMSRRPTPDYRMAELFAYYADDFALWDGAT
jgi:hypothetical protein